MYCRLAGVAMLAPVTNYWWSGIPYSESLKAFLTQPLQDQVATSIAHYAPFLTYWWNTQNLFPKSSVIQNRFDFFNDMDKEIIKRFAKNPSQVLFLYIILQQITINPEVEYQS